MSTHKMMLLLLLILNFNISSYMEIQGGAHIGGFSTRLYRRDFPGTPSYDPTLSLTNLISRAVDRSLARYNSSADIIPNSSTSATTLKYNNQDYMMKIALGTPPVELFVIIDLKSDLTWTECHPCQKCTHPLFHPDKSSTYQKIECIIGLAPCPLNLKSDGCKNNVCTYAYHYDSNVQSHGDISMEVLRIESTNGPMLVHTNYIFGCGFDNNGNLSPEASGIIGFNEGGSSSRSLMSQLDHIIHGRFSYCLVPDLVRQHTLSTINFGGHNPIISGPEVLSTRLFLNYEGTTSYFARLTRLTIGDEILSIAPRYSYIIIDPGSTLSIFPTHIYNAILRILARKINGSPVKDPTGRLHLCYFIEGLVIPQYVIARFLGASIMLNFENLFIQTAPGIVCVAIAQGVRPVWGNIAQINYLVGFDTHAKRLFFKPTDCTTI